jgi:hypothetical protein
MEGRGEVVFSPSPSFFTPPLHSTEYKSYKGREEVDGRKTPESRPLEARTRAREGPDTVEVSCGAGSSLDPLGIEALLVGGADEEVSAIAHEERAGSGVAGDDGAESVGGHGQLDALVDAALGGAGGAADDGGGGIGLENVEIGGSGAVSGGGANSGAATSCADTVGASTGGEGAVADGSGAGGGDGSWLVRAALGGGVEVEGASIAIVAVIGIGERGGIEEGGGLVPCHLGEGEGEHAEDQAECRDSEDDGVDGGIRAASAVVGVYVLVLGLLHFSFLLGWLGRRKGRTAREGSPPAGGQKLYTDRTAKTDMVVLSFRKTSWASFFREGVGKGEQRWERNDARIVFSFYIVR